jgi:hypothetical protein
MKRKILIVLAFTAATMIPVGMSAQAQSGKDICPTGGRAVKAVSYHLVGPAGDRTVAKLHGNTRLGDQITVTFTVPESCPSVVLSMASYRAPTAPPFSLQDAQQQTLFDSDTGTFTPGTYQMVVDVPTDEFGAVSPTTVPIAGGTTTAWDGIHGADKLPASGGVHWILADAQGVTNAVLTIDGTTYQMDHHGGSWSAIVPGPMTGSEDISFTYEGTGSPFLTLSSASHYQVDFVAHEVQNPPQYRLLVPRVGIGSDVG